LKSVSLPLSQYRDGAFEFQSDKQYVIFCAKGIRSLHLVELLRRQGLANTWSLIDGVDAIKDYFREHAGSIKEL